MPALGGERMAWIDRVDRTVGRMVAAARWLVLPVVLILFLQWPLRDFVRAYSARPTISAMDIRALCQPGGDLSLPASRAISRSTPSP
jgi:hypothetical protein